MAFPLNTIGGESRGGGWLDVIDTPIIVITIPDKNNTNGAVISITPNALLSGIGT